jgi:hypothetical protein
MAQLDERRRDGAANADVRIAHVPLQRRGGLLIAKFSQRGGNFDTQKNVGAGQRHEQRRTR